MPLEDVQAVNKIVTEIHLGLSTFYSRREY